MTDRSAELKKLRPPGPVAATCRDCPIFDRCGGIQNARPLMNCFDQFCCGDGSCDNVCIHHPDFRKQLWEIGGWDVDQLPQLNQEQLELPNFVPMVHHFNRRINQLQVDFAAIDPYKLFALKGGQYIAHADSPIRVREHFGISKNAKVILRGTAVDADLEKYWAYRHVSDACKLIASLDISLFIGPNFSTFLDVPRTDALFNRKRQILCLSELSEAGVSVAPHLSATMPADWRFWSSFLSNNPKVTHVALNCQTGYKRPHQGRTAIRKIEKIQQTLGRELKLILIGGGQFLDFASSKIKSVTLIDSNPFIKTMKRRRMDTSSNKRIWNESFSLENQPLDSLLRENVSSYGGWADRQVSSQETVMR